MQLPKSEQLNIASLSRLFDNKSECYKLFWFQAILHHVCKGQQEIRFEDLIDHMIVISTWVPGISWRKRSIIFPGARPCCPM